MEVQTLVSLATQCGAHKAALVPVEKIVFDAGFRKLCESNACGNYAKCWKCPPYAGEIKELIATAKSYRYALVYQTIGQLEDSYDFEGMMDAGKAHSVVSAKLSEQMAEIAFNSRLHLGAGGCHICPVCAKRTDEPCRLPEKAMASLETYGVDVSQLAALAGMNYINGQDTVTYFGAYFFVE